MNIYIYIITMAVVTYLIRMVPLVAFRKKIENRFVNSFLYYVPSILYSTESIISAVCGFAVALILGIKQKGLIVVAAAACVTVFVVEWILKFV